MSDEYLRKLLSGAGFADAEGVEHTDPTKLPIEKRLQELTDRVSLLDTVHVFTPGQLVTWKPGLCIMRSTGPFIFRRLIPAVPFDKDPASMFFCEQADCIVADLVVSQSNGDLTLAEWAVPGRRLEPYVSAAGLN